MEKREVENRNGKRLIYYEFDDEGGKEIAGETETEVGAETGDESEGASADEVGE